MGVAPSGVEKPNVGHHHLLIDKALTPEEMTQPITVDEQHVHFGKGQTETMVTLPPASTRCNLCLATGPTFLSSRDSIRSCHPHVKAARLRRSHEDRDDSGAKEKHRHHHHHHMMIY